MTALRLGACLAPDEERLYRALLDEPGTAGQLARRLGWARPAVDDVAHRLARTAFITTSSDGTLTPYDPELAVHLAAARRERSLRGALADLHTLRTSMGRHPLAPRDQRLHDARAVTVITATEAAARRGDIAALAATDLRRLVTGHAAAHQHGTAERRRVIYRRELFDNDQLRRHALHAQAQGEHVALVPEPLTNLVIADDTIALVELGDLGALVVHAAPLLTLLCHYYDLLWDNAFHLTRPRPECRWHLAEEDHQLLALLALGLKDQTIARHLGIGLRSVVRRIGILERTFNVETRFQLGAQATKRALL
jgi:hypothetical protein